MSAQTSKVVFQNDTVDQHISFAHGSMCDGFGRTLTHALHRPAPGWRTRTSVA